MLNLNLSTILLQIANFFILVFILYRFLFKPVQNVLKKREAEITKAMDDAKKAENEAEEMRKQFEEKTNNIDAEISAKRNEARIVIERTRQQMLQEVQERIEHLKAQTEETLSQMQMQAVQQHKQKLGNLATDFVQGILSDVMNPTLENVYQKEFIDRIQQMDLSSYLEKPTPGETPIVKVITAQPLNDEYQELLESSLHQKLDQPINITYEVDSDLIGGGILRFENELIDGSIQGQISDFKKKYQEKA